MNETASTPIAILAPSSGATLPVSTRPRRFSRLRSIFRRRPRAVSAPQGSRRERVRNYFTQRRARKQASAAARLSVGQKSRLSWGKFVIFFVVGAAVGLGAEALLNKAGLSPLASGVIITVVGVGLGIWTRGAWRAIGIGMASAGIGTVLVYELQGKPVSAAQTPTP